MAFFSFALHSACVLPSTFLMIRFPVSGWYPELAEQVERAQKELRWDMDAAGHRRLLRLLDAQNALLAESKLMRFTAGFKLAWGMAKELEADGFYSFEREEEEHMKRKTSHWVLLALALSTVLLLAACGASGSAADGSQQEESVTGTINRLDTDYLVLITDDGEYQVMDFGENFSVEGFSEGDDVVITYTGTLENEEKPPVITAMEAAQ